MENDTDTCEPYTLWFETLPSSDTARLVIWYRSGHVKVVLHWNQRFHSERSFATLESAEAWGREFRDLLEQDALAGALLGYDHDVLTRLQDQCTLTF